MDRSSAVVSPARNVLRIVAIGLAGAVPTTPATAGDAWTRQAPHPADVDLMAVYFTSPTSGVIAGQDDLLMTTSDGMTWTQTPSIAREPQFSEDPIWDIDFVDALHGWAWGNKGYRTTDGGQTWQELPFAGTIYDVDFIDAQTGYLISNLSVMRTDDGGQSTTMVWDWADFNFIAGGDFIDADTGLLAAEQDDVPGVFRTTDGGASWQRISNQLLGRILHVEGNVWVGAANGRFYRSGDGGASWTLVLDDSGEGNDAIEELRLVDADSIAAIDINARIWMSHDAGQTWTRTYGPLGNWGFEWSIQFPTPEIGYAVGRLGIMLRTEDGGSTWTQVSNGAAAPMSDIVVLSDGTGVAVGAQGTIVTTDDFGARWTVQQVSDEMGIAQHLTTVQHVGGGSFVAAGEQGVVHRSDDGGATWTLAAQMPYDKIFDVEFVDGNEGWATGRSIVPWGFIAHTTDGGYTWDRIDDFDVYPATSVRVLPSRRGRALVPQTSQLMTDDGFETYTGRALPSGESWQSFDYASDDIGWYGGFFGNIMKTTNGGYLFHDQDLPGFIHGSGAGTDRLTDLVAISTEQAYVATRRGGAIDRGIIYETLNGGATWTPLEHIMEPTNQFAAAIGAFSVHANGSIWATGGNGFIFNNGHAVPGDVDGDGLVGTADLLAVLAAWGPCGGCAADLDGDGSVALGDLLIVLASWS